MLIITMNNIFCYNCGNVGHLYKLCHSPIISNGIICFKNLNILIPMILKKN